MCGVCGVVCGVAVGRVCVEKCPSELWAVDVVSLHMFFDTVCGVCGVVYMWLCDVCCVIGMV